MPVFGSSLEDHLRRTNREIAMVLEESIGVLIQIGLEEEVCCACRYLHMYRLFTLYKADLIQ